MGMAPSASEASAAFIVETVTGAAVEHADTGGIQQPDFILKDTGSEEVTGVLEVTTLTDPRQEALWNGTFRDGSTYEAEGLQGNWIVYYEGSQPAKDFLDRLRVEIGRVEVDHSTSLAGPVIVFNSDHLASYPGLLQMGVRGLTRLPTATGEPARISIQGSYSRLGSSIEQLWIEGLERSNLADNQAKLKMYGQLEWRELWLWVSWQSGFTVALRDAYVMLQSGSAVGLPGLGQAATPNRVWLATWFGWTPNFSAVVVAVDSFGWHAHPLSGDVERRAASIFHGLH